MKIALHSKVSIFLLLLLLSAVTPKARGQVVLGATSPYIENFDNIGTGLPAGFTVTTSATATTLGTPSALITAPAGWASTSGGIKNFASATGNAATLPTNDQGALANRALGVRQTGSLGDPGAAFVFQVANTTGRTGFKLVFKLQSLDAGSPRKTTWQVQYGIGIAPASFSAPLTVTGDVTTGNSSFTNTDISVDFGTALDNINDIVTIRIVSLSTTTGSGNRPSTGIDDFQLNWIATDPNAPALSAKDKNGLNLTKINFPTVTLGFPRDSSFFVTGSNLEGDVQLSVSGTAFRLSEDGTDYSSTLTIPRAETSNKKIYVRFDPASAGEFMEAVSITATGAPGIDINLNGIGYDPNLTSYNFNTCTNLGEPGDGFSEYSVSGDAQVWTCTTFGRNNTNGVNMNGYVSGAQLNEDWLISPMITKTFTQIPVLSFYSRGEFNGPALSVWISSDYNGSGNPNDFTWTNLNADFPPTSNTWILTDNIDLSAYKNKPFYIAFKYVSSIAEGAARWTLDDVSVEDRSSLFSVSPILNDFGNIAVGAVSGSRRLKLRSVGYGAVTITAPANFELSKDNVSFGNALVVSQTDAAADTGLAFYVRFAPKVKVLKIADSLHFTGSMGLNNHIIQLTGSSYPQEETFDIAAYNLSFFASSGSSAIVRTKEQIDQQIGNIEEVLQKMDADVVSFEEMSNDDSLKSMLVDLNAKTGKNYKSLISGFWSHMESVDPTYPPQKIGFIYNADVVTPDPAAPPRAMFNEGFTAGTVYPADFWASGRLPFIATFIVNIQGIKQRVKMIVIHGKAGSDIDSYNRRLSDLQVLHDSLATSDYSNDNLLIMGDFNDRLSTSIAAGQPSSYQMFVTDPAYAKLTYAMDTSGVVSFINGGDGVIDNILFRQGTGAGTSTSSVVSNNPRSLNRSVKMKVTSSRSGLQLKPDFYTSTSASLQSPFSPISKTLQTAGSLQMGATGALAAEEAGVVYLDSTVTVLDPRTYISPYDKVVASDHLPVFARFNLVSSDISLPVGLFGLQAVLNNGSVRLSWQTGSELNSRQFSIERSVNGLDFVQLGTQPAAGNSSKTLQYYFDDDNPVNGWNYYRVGEFTADNVVSYSTVASLNYQKGATITPQSLEVAPNPVHNHMEIKIGISGQEVISGISFQATIYNTSGVQVLSASGSLKGINEQINRRLGNLPGGIYFIRLKSSGQSYQGKFLKY